MDLTDVRTASKYKKPAGPYVPPAKRVKAEKFEVGSEEFQREAWEENKKKIIRIINKASLPNVTVLVKELFELNLIRYKGLFASALLRAQERCPKFTEVYAAILAVVNSRIKTIGALVINRLILQYRVSFLSNNKPKCLASVKFIAHLINQEVIHEVLGFQLIDHLINKPTASSVEIVISFLEECAAKLDQLNSAYLFEVFRTLRDLRHEGEFDTRTHEMIDLIHEKRKNKFRDHQPIKKELDLIEEDDKITHTIELGEPRKEQFKTELNYFKFDPNWSVNEAKYESFKEKLLGDESDSSSEGDNQTSDSEEDPSGDEVDRKEEDKKPIIDKKPETVIDETGTDIIAFRRTVYLTFKSSVRHEEVVHKLLKARISAELNGELCQMILDGCGQERAYESIFGLVASKLCQINRREFGPHFEQLLRMFYESVHKFETNKIRNIAKFYAHLLATESIDWSCLTCLKLREDATTSAGRCFIKFLFQELVSILSLTTLKEYIKDPQNEEAFKELFPKDTEQDMRFAINFFTFSELGELTDELRQELLAKQ